MNVVNFRSGKNRNNYTGKTKGEKVEKKTLLRSRLIVHYQLSDIQILNDESIKTIVYMTEGFGAIQQYELFLMIRLSGSDKKGKTAKQIGIPETIETYFKTIYKFSENGNKIEEKDHTEFGKLFLGTFKGIYYSKQALPQGIRKPNVGTPYLVCVGATEEEVEIGKKYGTSRLLTNLGHTYRWYPCPPWNDISKRRKGKAAVRKIDMEQSILGQLLHIMVSEVYVRLDHQHHLILSISNYSHQEMKKDLKQLLATQTQTITTFILRTLIDQKATSHLAWDGTHSKPVCISKEVNLNANSVGGSYLGFVVETTNTFRMVEDGYVLYLELSMMKRVIDAIMKMEPISVPLHNDCLFSIEWTSQHDMNTLEQQYQRQAMETPMIMEAAEPLTNIPQHLTQLENVTFRTPYTVLQSRETNRVGQTTRHAQTVQKIDSLILQYVGRHQANQIKKNAFQSWTFVVECLVKGNCKLRLFKHVTQQGKFSKKQRALIEEIIVLLNADSALTHHDYLDGPDVIYHLTFRLRL